MPKSSIVIPVFNKWELTRSCLRSLAATTQDTEVIVVDNASSDVTPQGCPFLGKQLFGGNFQYIRNEQNRNFAGACNQGADAARGEYVIFLNNDTVAEKGWHEPLLQDFRDFPNLAATGPLLVYPDSGPFGRTVQHLGVLISPFLKAGHLYQGLPESSRLAKKRRFFQAITAACFAIPKRLFEEAGKFDEGYVNGFEDVDLCARLTGMGYRFTVNPEATVVHLESQTPGRGREEDRNFARLLESNLKLFRPDWHLLLAQDGFSLEVDSWLSLKPELLPELRQVVNRKLGDMGFNALKGLVCDYVYWQEGWKRMLELQPENEDRSRYYESYFRFCRTVPVGLQSLRIARECKNQDLEKRIESFLAISWKRPEEMLRDAKTAQVYCEKKGLRDQALKYENWIANYKKFKQKIYPDYEKEMQKLGFCEQQAAK